MISDLNLALLGSFATLVGGIWALYNRIQSEKESSTFQKKVVKLTDEIRSLQEDTINKLQGESFPVLTCETIILRSSTFVKFNLTNVKKQPVFDVKIYYEDTYPKSLFTLDVEHIKSIPFPTPEQYDIIQEKYLKKFQRRYEYFSIAPGEVINVSIFKMGRGFPILESIYEIDVIWRNGGTYKYCIQFEIIQSAPENDGNQPKETWKVKEEYYLIDNKRYNKKEFLSFVKNEI